MTKFCNACKTNKGISEFWISQSQCILCKQKYKIKYEKDNRSKLTKSIVAKSRKRKIELVNLLGNNCSICDTSFHMSAMEFHHIDIKEKSISSIIQNSWISIKKELEKCILVCSNCHKFIHYEGRQIHIHSVEQLKQTNLCSIKEYLIYNIRKLKNDITTQALTS